MTAKLTPVEVVAWLRKQSQAYSDAADLIEAASFPAETGRSDLRPIGAASAMNGHRPIIYATEGPLSIKSLRARLKLRNARAGDLAKHFGVNEDKIWELVNSEDSGIRMADRGWLKLETADDLVEDLLPKPPIS